MQLIKFMFGFGIHQDQFLLWIINSESIPLNTAKEFHLARSISSIEGQPLLEVKLAPSIKVAACPKKY